MADGTKLEETKHVDMEGRCRFDDLVLNRAAITTEGLGADDLRQYSESRVLLLPPLGFGGGGGSNPQAGDSFPRERCPEFHFASLSKVIFFSRPFSDRFRS